MKAFRICQPACHAEDGLWLSKQYGRPGQRQKTKHAWFPEFACLLDIPRGPAWGLRQIWQGGLFVSLMKTPADLWRYSQIAAVFLCPVQLFPGCVMVGTAFYPTRRIAWPLGCIAAAHSAFARESSFHRVCFCCPLIDLSVKLVLLLLTLIL